MPGGILSGNVALASQGMCRQALDSHVIIVFHFG